MAGKAKRAKTRGRKWTPPNRPAVAAFNDRRRTREITEYDANKRKHVVVRTIRKHPSQ